MKISTTVLRQIIKEELIRLQESEVYVDEHGYAHDDEGNSWYVGRGHSTGRASYSGPEARDAGLYSKAGENTKPATSVSQSAKQDPDAMEMRAYKSVLNAYLEKYDNKFMASLAVHVSKNRILSPKQKAIALKILKKT
jgi:hypothetical protein